MFFQGPHSFTGEDVVEFQGHGGSAVLRLVLKACFDAGARPAQPGEFSLRAFHHGKIDLLQAEAIADLILSDSETEARLAMRTLSGEFSEKIHAWEKLLIGLRVFVEASVDFPDEDLEFIQDEKIKEKIVRLVEELEKIEKSAERGAKLRNGIYVALLGKPNVGKSSLMNALCENPVAIVTDIPGTTRDVLKENLLWKGFSFHLHDTAGLRESNDPVEKEGIQRAEALAKEADLVVWITELQENLELPEGLKPEQKIVFIHNKIDLSGEAPRREKEGSIERIYLSCKEKKGLDLLKDFFRRVCQPKNTGDVFLARARHLAVLSEVKNFLNQAVFDVSMGL